MDAIRAMLGHLRDPKTKEDPFGLTHKVLALALAFLGMTDTTSLYDQLVPAGIHGMSHRGVQSRLQIQAELAGFYGDINLVVTALERLVDAGSVDLLWLDGCPLLAGVRSEPSYIKARQQVQARAHAAYDAFRL